MACCKYSSLICSGSSYAYWLDLGSGSAGGPTLPAQERLVSGLVLVLCRQRDGSGSLFLLVYAHTVFGTSIWFAIYVPACSAEIAFW